MPERVTLSGPLLTQQYVFTGRPASVTVDCSEAGVGTLFATFLESFDGGRAKELVRQARRTPPAPAIGTGGSLVTKPNVFALEWLPERPGAHQLCVVFAGQEVRRRDINVKRFVDLLQFQVLHLPPREGTCTHRHSAIQRTTDLT